MFNKRTLLKDSGITTKNLDLKIQYSVLKQPGPGVFDFSPYHIFEHTIELEFGHLSSLLKAVISKYLSLRLKTYGKRISEMVVKQILSSLFHEMTKNNIV